MTGNLSQISRVSIARGANPSLWVQKLSCWEAGAHQMEPPSPLISWVNPFPSRFINRTACFPRHISVNLVCHREKKIKLDEVVLRGPSFDRFPFLLYVHFYSFTTAGIWDEIKVNELPDWDWAWSDGTKAANWGSRKGSLRVFFLFVLFSFLPSYIPHLSMHLEKSRRLSVLWTIWNFSMIRGPFLESPDNLTGPESYFQIKVSRKVGWVLTSNEVHFVSLANNSTV